MFPLLLAVKILRKQKNSNMYFQKYILSKGSLRARVIEMYSLLFSPCGFTVAFHDVLVVLVKLIKK